jgi:hypothetical protein
LVIKGIGINSKGDMIIGTTTTGSQMIYVLEKRGIVKGTVPVTNGWNIHSVSSDGKVAMTIPRGDNRFKVRVLENDGTGHVFIGDRNCSLDYSPLFKHINHLGTSCGSSNDHVPFTINTNALYALSLNCCRQFNFFLQPLQG